MVSAVKGMFRKFPSLLSKLPGLATRLAEALLQYGGLSKADAAKEAEKAEKEISKVVPHMDRPQQSGLELFLVYGWLRGCDPFITLWIIL